MTSLCGIGPCLMLLPFAFMAGGEAGLTAAAILISLSALFTALIITIRRKTRRPALVLDRTGLVVNSMLFGSHHLNWSEIRKVEIVTFRVFERVGVGLTRSAADRVTGSSAVKRCLMHLDNRMLGDTLVINPYYMKTDPAKLLAAIRERLRRFKAESDGGPRKTTADRGDGAEHIRLRRA